MTAERKEALNSASGLEDLARILTGLELPQLRERYSQHERWGERVRSMNEAQFRNFIAARLDSYLD